MLVAFKVLFGSRAGLLFLLLSAFILGQLDDIVVKGDSRGWPGYKSGSRFLNVLYSRSVWHLCGIGTIFSIMTVVWKCFFSHFLLDLLQRGNIWYIL